MVEFKRCGTLMFYGVLSMGRHKKMHAQIIRLCVSVFVCRHYSSGVVLCCILNSMFVC